ncbi:MAG: hypothetical protein L3J43_08660, partial [Sulfurovum sp.]|nr:hypothetical protein [Sulfurovum sp.]
MKVPVKYLSLIPASLFFVACGGGDISSANSGESIMQGEENDPKPITNGRVLYYPNPTPTLNSIKNITIKEENQIEDLGQGNNVKATINVGQTPKSLYVLISNHDERYTSVPKLISSGKNVQTNKRMKDVAIVVPTIHAKRSRHAPAYIQVFNRNIKKLLKDTPSTGKKSKKFKKDTYVYKKDVAGAPKGFYFEQDRSKSTTATARKVIS